MHALPPKLSQVQLDPDAQSASVVQWSYEHEHAGTAPNGPHLPLEPAVQSLSALHLLFASKAVGQTPAGRAAEHIAPVSRCFVGTLLELPALPPELLPELPPELLPALFGEPPELSPPMFTDPAELLDPAFELPELPAEPPVELLPPTAMAEGELDWPPHATARVARTASDRDRETTALEFMVGAQANRVPTDTVGNPAV